MEKLSFQERLELYAANNKNTEPDCTFYLEDFFNFKWIKHLHQSPKGLSVLKLTPGEIGNKKGKPSVLRGIIYRYIRSLHFEKRLDALRQFNDAIGEKDERGIYGFSELFKLQKKTNRATKFLDCSKVLSSIEIEIILLKRLQVEEFAKRQMRGQVPSDARNNKNEVTREFGFSEATRKEYFDRLQNSHSLLGSNVQVLFADDPVSYESTIHPVFLALNLVEVNLLTTMLKNNFQDTGLSDVANDIADDIYRQLSEHARSVIDRSAKKLGVKFEHAPKELEKKAGYRQERAGLDSCYKRDCFGSLTLKKDLSHPYSGTLSCVGHNKFEFFDDADSPIFKDNEGNLKRISYFDIEEFVFKGYK